MLKLTVSIDVPDQDKAAAFYCNSFDCQQTRREGACLVLTIGSVEVYLLKRAEGSRPVPDSTATRSFARHWTPVHLDFCVDDLQAVLRRVTDNGGQFEGWEDGMEDRIAYCADPFGHGFCLIQN